MVETPGTCSNLDFCSIAASGHRVRVALEDPFICPECGSTLSPPGFDTISRRTRMIALLVVVIVFAAIAAGATVLARGGFFEARKPAPEAPATTVDLAPVTLPAPAPSITVDPLAVPSPADIPPEDVAARPSRRGGPKTHLLASRLGAAPAGQSGRRHANVHMAVSIPLIAGGRPEYPEQYDDGRSGSVTVACGLRPDGGTAECRTTRLSGGRIFDVAVHSWLELRDVRFQQPKAAHRPPIRNVTLTVQFIGDGPTP